MQKITDEEFINRVKRLGNNEYIPLDPYTGAKCRVRMKHLPCGVVRTITASEFLRGSARCPGCSKKRRRAKKFKEIKDKLKDKYGDEYTVLDTQYKTLHTKMRVRHNVCGNTIWVTMDALLQQPLCSYCHGGIRRSDKEFRKKVRELTDDEYTFLDRYINSATKIRVKHNACGYIYKVRPNDFLRGSGRCPKCNSAIYRTTESYKQEIKDIYGDEYTVLGEYKNRTAKIKVRHNKCGYVWNVPAKNLLTGHGCPVCLQSRGERFVYQVLVHDLGLSKDQFKYGYVIPDLKYKSNLHFDFWIPSIKTAIEYDGKQHYESNEFFDKRESLYIRQERDCKKNQYCKDNSIRLIRVPYTYNTYDKVRDLLLTRLS